MILPRSEDALHKAMLYRLLTEILDDTITAQSLYFKGGTCAAMLGWLDRFSLDLDFDLRYGVVKEDLRNRFKVIFPSAGFTIQQEDKKELFFILKYQAATGKRNTIKLSIVNQPLKSALYDVYSLAEIDRLAGCQTKETMFANKLVALIERYEKYRTVAGRDAYDIWYFFGQGFRYRPEVIKERRRKSILSFMKELTEFVEDKITEIVISQDLNYLLTAKKFNQIRKILKSELLMFLHDETVRVRQRSDGKLI